jgi:hypothetical protein
MDRAQRYWVVNQDDAPDLFSSSGAFLRRLGRRGSGPGEYAGAVDILPLGQGSILALDRLGGRLSVLDSELRLTRTLPMGAALSAGVESRSGVVLTGMVRTPAGVGLALHRVDITGAQLSIASSFGGSKRPTTPDTPSTSFLWHLSPDQEGGFWSLDRWEYRLQHWSAGLSNDIEIIRESAHFPAGRTIGGIGTPKQPPASRTIGVWVSEEDSTAWTAYLVASENWRQAWSGIPAGASEASQRQIHAEYLFSTVVEAISLSTWRVIARRTFEGTAVGMLPGARLALYQVDEEGEPNLSVRRLRIDRR